LPRNIKRPKNQHDEAEDFKEISFVSGSRLTYGPSSDGPCVSGC